jgi:hypothetical protein
MGIYSIKVYFLTPPTPHDVATVLETMTGFRVATPPAEARELQLTSPAHPAQPIILNWCSDRQQKYAQLDAAFRLSHVLPFAAYPVSITLEAEPINTRAHSYVRNVALAALLHLGGVAEEPFTLPAWANQPWHEVPPRSFWQKVKSLYLLEF